MKKFGELVLATAAGAPCLFLHTRRRKRRREEE